VTVVVSKEALQDRCTPFSIKQLEEHKALLKRTRAFSRPPTQHSLSIRRRYRNARNPGKHDPLLLIKRLALQFFWDANFVLAGDLGKDADTFCKSKTLSDATACSS